MEDTSGFAERPGRAGLLGSDSFSYRATATVNGTTSTVYSAPATVVIKVSEPSCNDADLATPYGELDFFGVSAFLVAFLMAFGDGCP